MAAKVLDVDLSRAKADLAVNGPYEWASILVRWGDAALGRVRLPVDEHRVALAAIWAAARASFGDVLRRHAVDALLFPEDEPLPSEASGPCAGSVIVCTRDRPQDLARCLEAILQCRPQPLEVIVVDNAPPDDASARVAAAYPVRYVVEPRQGLNWARSRGARIATGDLLLFTDDDVKVEPGWAGALCRPFADPEVAAVTGLVLPLELETQAQEDFERFAGFSRGFAQRRFTSGNLSPVAAGNVGAGASMALRRSLVIALGLFDCELDCGTAAQSGGDAYAFYRLLRDGHAIVYTPAARCLHRHRRTEPELVRTLRGYSVGVYTCLARCLCVDRDWAALRAGTGWFVDHHLRNAARALLRRPNAPPLRFTLAEIAGMLAAPAAYAATRRRERELARRARAERAV